MAGLRSHPNNARTRIIGERPWGLEPSQNGRQRAFVDAADIPLTCHSSLSLRLPDRERTLKSLTLPLLSITIAFWCVLYHNTFARQWTGIKNCIEPDCST